MSKRKKVSRQRTSKNTGSTFESFLKEEKIGLKFDDNKTRVDLIPWEALDEIGKVLKFGASKYGESNWKNGIKTNRLLGAAIRHIYQFKDVEDLDQESKTLHIANACANLMFAIWMLKNKPEFDNRHEAKNKKTK